MGTAEDGAKGEARLIGRLGQFLVINPFLIGRGRNNDLTLAEAEISRRHAMIFECAGRWWVTDMGSRNGVLVNGKRLIHARPLCDRDQIRIGGHTFTFSTTDAPLSSVSAREALTEVAATVDESSSPSQGAVTCELIVASADGEILEGEKAALAFFGKALEHPLGTSRTLLPPIVRRWLAKQTAEGSSRYELLEYEDNKGRRLVVTLSNRRENSHYLLLREESALVAMRRMKALGLTSREAEVMHWICDGKKNAEIAEIIDVSVHTVNRHVEHIFKKLGVDNRQKAILAVMERLSS